MEEALKRAKKEGDVEEKGSAWDAFRAMRLGEDQLSGVEDEEDNGMRGEGKSSKGQAISPMKGKAKENKTWTCRTCSYKNPERLDGCDVCGDAE